MSEIDQGKGAAMVNMTRELLEDLERRTLASYAFCSADSRGRVHPQAKHAYRTEFQRDRERIVHCTAFRRLLYKTQVFVNHEGDMYRTRLTHTIEVATLSRSLAVALRLNSDLAEAIALAHDLGHTPFGHAGEEAMCELMKDHGGFEHNRQTLRVVDCLEKKYPEFDGINLTHEVREGLIKHHTIYDKPEEGELRPDDHPPLEVQIVNLADQITYACHDLDDGLYSGLLTEDLCMSVDLFREHYEETVKAYPTLNEEGRRANIIRLLIDREVRDCLETTRACIDAAGVASVEDVRHAGRMLVTQSESLLAKNAQLNAFLYENMYRHYRVTRMSEKAKRVMTALFQSYTANINQLPPTSRRRALEAKDPLTVVCDYIAGMTDRYALSEYKKMFDPFERV